MERRQNEIDGFIDQDFLIATRMQGLVDKKLEVLEKVEDMDVKELRQSTFRCRDMNLDLRVLLTLGKFGEEAKHWVRSRGGLLENDHPP